MAKDKELKTESLSEGQDNKPEPELKLTKKMIAKAHDYVDKQRQDVTTDSNGIIKVGLDKLEKYYLGQHEQITERQKDPDLKNNKIIVNHCKKVVDTRTGYSLGEPIKYIPEEVEGQKIDLQPILDEYNKQTIERHDSTLFTKVGIMGYGYEYHYVRANKKDPTKNDLVSTYIDPRNAYIEYDGTIEKRKEWALIWDEKSNTEDDDDDVKQYILLTESSTDTYEVAKGSEIKLIHSTPNITGRVMLTEYKNNDEKQGDFEQAISLNDAINLIQSDRVNDTEQLVEALLAITGGELEDDDIEELKKSRVMFLPEGADAKYLIKSLQENDIEVLKKSLIDDFYETTMTANYSDDQFGGQKSGVALELKQMPFKNSIDIKQNHMSAGLDERFEIYAAYLHATGRLKEMYDASDMSIEFTSNTPKNELEQAEIFSKYANTDKLPLKTLLTDVYGHEAAEEAMELLEAEKASRYSSIMANADGSDRNVFAGALDVEEDEHDNQSE